jgi:hypothetical protein
MQIYHFFGFLWIIQFIIAIEQTTIAGAVAMWYWVRNVSVSVCHFRALTDTLVGYSNATCFLLFLAGVTIPSWLHGLWILYNSTSQIC